MAIATPGNILRIEGLSKSFGSLNAVDGLDFSVREGEIFGFLGPNGAGKTTTIHMLCGLLKPDRGHIFLRDSALDRDGRTRRARLGLCPQDTVLWELLTCREQLVFSAEMYGIKKKRAREKAHFLLERLGLSEKGKTLSKNLSGGMKRRLNIALALVHDPGIVILDEPEAGLDPQSRVLVREFIRSLAPGKTVIFTSHNMDEVERICDRAAIIDHGKLLVLDTVENLKKSAGEGDVIEFTVPAETDRDKTETVLRQGLKEQLKGVTLLDNRLIIRVTDGAHQLPKILEILSREHIDGNDIGFRPNTLEDVFINLTGRSLRQ